MCDAFGAVPGLRFAVLVPCLPQLARGSESPTASSLADIPAPAEATRPGRSASLQGALAIERGDRVIGLSFDYGQRRRRELAAAAELAAALGLAEHHQVAVNLAAWGGSSLTD